MPRSKRWQDLRREVDVLRRYFLPDSFEPLGVYSEQFRVHAHTRAFLVLCHAAIESYLEDWAKDIAQRSEVVWTTSQKITEPLAFLLATYSDRLDVPNSLVGLQARDSPQRLTEATVKLFQKFYKQINDNHGIKEKNVLALLVPLGVPASALGTTLLPNLDNLATIRGVHAHRSANAVQTVLDPQTEYNRVISLVDELIVLDEWLAQYKRHIR